MLWIMAGNQDPIEEEKHSLPGRHQANPCTQVKVPDKYKALKIKNVLNIGTWNIQIMYQASKAANAMKEIQILNVNILECSEVRWPD